MNYSNENNCKVVLEIKTQQYVTIQDIYYLSPEAVYMTEECAVEICRMLNNGEFVL
jgi:hypothetical protein